MIANSQCKQMYHEANPIVWSQNIFVERWQATWLKGVGVKKATLESSEGMSTPLPVAL
jgi:hypothetical protein